MSIIAASWAAVRPGTNVRFGSIADSRRQIGDVRCNPESRHPICATRPSCAISRGAEPRATARYTARASLRTCGFPPRLSVPIGNAGKVVFRNARRAIILTVGVRFCAKIYAQPDGAPWCARVRALGKDPIRQHKKIFFRVHFPTRATRGPHRRFIRGSLGKPAQNPSFYRGSPAHKGRRKKSGRELFSALVRPTPRIADRIRCVKW